MFLSDQWKDYALLRAGNGEKLEKWGDVLLLRPDPQAIWPMRGNGTAGATVGSIADAHYIRSTSGGGHWEYSRTLPDSWQIQYRSLTFLVRPTNFKHTGLFPEQAVNWDWMQSLLKTRPGANVLNLFAYTGGATCACAASGATVVHVDAAKGMVHWAKENLALCGLANVPVRFLIDDAMKFVLREQRRGNRYDAILMDPPSYGRGPNGEMWKIEQDLYPLVEAAASLLSDAPLFFLVNSYTTGLAPSVLGTMLHMALPGEGIRVASDEVGLPMQYEQGLVLPCGSSGRAWWS